MNKTGLFLKGFLRGSCYFVALSVFFFTANPATAQLPPLESLEEALAREFSEEFDLLDDEQSGPIVREERVTSLFGGWPCECAINHTGGIVRTSFVNVSGCDAICGGTCKVRVLEHWPQRPDGSYDFWNPQRVSLDYVGSCRPRP